MFVGVCRLVFHLPGNSSLKGKRSVVRKIVERTRAKFNVSVAEVDQNDVYQRAIIGTAVVGNDSAHVDSMLASISRFMESIGVAVLVAKETEVIPLGGEIGDGDIFLPPDTDGLPWDDL